MYCTSCGSQIDTDAKHCASCGAALEQTPPPTDGSGARSGSGLEHELRYVIPVNTPIAALAAGYLGLLSVLLIPAPLAIITGVIGLVQISRRDNARGHARCWFGIAAGLLFSALFAYIMLFTG